MNKHQLSLRISINNKQPTTTSSKHFEDNEKELLHHFSNLILMDLLTPNDFKPAQMAVDKAIKGVLMTHGAHLKTPQKLVRLSCEHDGMAILHIKEGQSIDNNCCFGGSSSSSDNSSSSSSVYYHEMMFSSFNFSRMWSQCDVFVVNVRLTPYSDMEWAGLKKIATLLGLNRRAGQKSPLRALDGYTELLQLILE